MIFQTSVLFYELARFLRSILHKSLIFNHLRPAARLATVSALLSALYEVFAELAVGRDALQPRRGVVVPQAHGEQ